MRSSTFTHLSHKQPLKVCLSTVLTFLGFNQISKDIHIVEWDKWKSMKITNKKTTEIQSKKVFVKHSTQLSELEQELQKQIEELSNHQVAIHTIYKA
jgi:polyferredoxin